MQAWCHGSAERPRTPKRAGHGSTKGALMGYGLGVTLIAIGLILALAVQDRIDAIDLTMVGWIVAGAGVLLTVLTAVTLNNRRRTAATTTHPDGSQTVRRSTDGPAV
jgi:hypothetical protein